MPPHHHPHKYANWPRPRIQPPLFRPEMIGRRQCLFGNCLQTFPRDPYDMTRKQIMAAISEHAYWSDPRGGHPARAGCLWLSQQTRRFSPSAPA